MFTCIYEYLSLISGEAVWALAYARIYCLFCSEEPLSYVHCIYIIDVIYSLLLYHFLSYVMIVFGVWW